MDKLPDAYLLCGTDCYYLQLATGAARAALSDEDYLKLTEAELEAWLDLCDFHGLDVKPLL